MDESSLGRNNNSLSDEKTPVVMQIEVIDVSDDEQTVKFKSNYSKNENQRVWHISLSTRSNKSNINGISGANNAWGDIGDSSTGQEVNFSGDKELGCADPKHGSLASRRVKQAQKRRIG